jgi:hypothetical protein
MQEDWQVRKPALRARKIDVRYEIYVGIVSRQEAAAVTTGGMGGEETKVLKPMRRIALRRFGNLRSFLNRRAVSKIQRDYSTPLTL